MTEPTTHRCPFCKRTVYHRGHKLAHEAPECAEFRKWLDETPPLIPPAPLDLALANEEPAAWEPLIAEVQRVGLGKATPEQREAWAKALEQLDAPYLAKAIRGTQSPD